ncbi:hypothetical protein CBS101457_004855 [Exobasidium rhododendri]|nr:hypothetical protein CBS101457_004855 [Exobasidium rhododendri]
MDHWDPVLIDTLGRNRTVILFDNAGVGRSAGTVPETFHGWADCAIKLMEELGFVQYDVLGFSMGGMVAQLIALEAKDAVRHLVLAGTSPSAGEGVVASDPGPFLGLVEAGSEEEKKAAFLASFFHKSSASQLRGEDWWKRMTSARSHRSDYVDQKGTASQVAAVQAWYNADLSAQGSYHRLDEITIPVFIANGSKDLLVDTENSILLWRRLMNAPTHLHIYPNSGHGFLDEFSAHFGQIVSQFLDDDL